MHEPILSPVPVLTLTVNDQDLYRVLLDGEPACGPYAFRESAEAAREHLDGIRYPGVLR